MANPIDYAGMLTGISQDPQMQATQLLRQPNSAGMGVIAQANNAGRPERLERARRGLGGLMGKDLRSPSQKAQEELSKIGNPTTPEQKQQVLQLLTSIGDPRAVAYSKQLELENSNTADKISLTNYVKEKYPNDPELAKLVQSGVVTVENLKEFVSSPTKSGTQVIQREVEGQVKNILINSGTGTDIKDLGVKTSISALDVPTQVVQRSVNNVLQNVLINSNTGVDIKTLGPRENPNLRTDTISRNINGRVHTILINADTGEDIRDLGPSTDKETQMSTILDEDTGIEHRVMLDKKGNILKTIGVSKLPTYRVLSNDDGTYQVANDTLGTLGPKVPTLESAQQQQERFTVLLSKIAAVDNTLGTVEEARAEVTKGATGFDYFVFSSLPFDTDSRRLKQRVSTLQANLGFDKLQAMRDASPTGGALGQVSNLELNLLVSALTALDGVASAEDFNKQLDKVKKHYSNFKKALLGQTPDIDFNSSVYQGLVTVQNNVRYMKDPNTGEVYNLGKVKK